MVPMLFSSWALFGSIGHNSWANSYLMIDYLDPRVYISFFIIEGLIFFVGLIIFILGLGRLVKGRLHKETVVTTGIYKYIRHPQNLGILLMIFPFTLFLPTRSGGYWSDPGIRTGDIMSWVLMVALVSIAALIEEQMLIKKFGTDYLDYYATTGFMFPKIGKKRKKPIKLWKSVIIVLFLYGIFVLITFGTQRLLLKLGLVFWSRTF
jgi:protein-S-isoprenylcysteine O-methyltransferase Ste14